ncbi:MAG: hypothetical protein N2Z23_06190 [Pyrinomonadaceae bacterium]|nr:hypothetical protein [Pyrinomonadaceae bacterium]MCX7640012.1 hypothetical protein [Pyrinomonadaceae bacterium]MDW8304184.1 hypothetical protein [Acidobacteriota bacterium]
MADIEKKKKAESLREKVQYGLTLVAISTMLVAIGFPFFIVVFFGLFGFLLWKVFSLPSAKDLQEVFEFYLTANEILRDDERRWFGFEIQDAISQGEYLLKLFPESSAPPLLYFTVGALYYRIGNYGLAEKYLSQVIERAEFDELSYLNPSEELRSYTKILRKIENEPTEAPLTSAAVRALERARRHRGLKMLEESRRRLLEMRVSDQQKALMETTKSEVLQKRREARPSQPRKSISELLHDIYDGQ